MAALGSEKTAENVADGGRNPERKKESKRKRGEGDVSAKKRRCLVTISLCCDAGKVLMERTAGGGAEGT